MANRPPRVVCKTISSAGQCPNLTYELADGHTSQIDGPRKDVQAAIAAEASAK